MLFNWLILFKITKTIKTMQIYSENKKTVDDHNAKYAAGQATYDMEMNHLADKVLL